MHAVWCYVLYCILDIRSSLYWVLGLLGIRAYALDATSRATALQKSRYLYMWFIESGIAKQPLSTVLWGLFEMN